ncbi:MAG: aldehyde dehydrogenase family protein, partial [Acidobacteriota bacterium]
MSATVEVPTFGRPDTATLRVTNPATGELVGEVPDLDAAGVAAAVARARAAAPSWAAA